MTMKKVLRLTDYGVQAAMQHPLLRGKTVIGRGVFSAVFEGTRKDTVLKMTTDDIGYYLLNCCASRVTHWHFPRVVDTHYCIGDVKRSGEEFPIYLFEMERLEMLQSNTQAKQLASKIKSVSNDSVSRVPYRDRGTERRACLTALEMSRDTLLPGSIRNTLRQLSDFLSNYGGGSLDMHLGNFMQRKNGDLVIIDPVANMKIWDKACGRQRIW